jgi:hypothetical protein
MTTSTSIPQGQNKQYELSAITNPSTYIPSLSELPFGQVTSLVESGMPGQLISQIPDISTSVVSAGLVRDI